MGVPVRYLPPQANKEQFPPVPGPSQPRGPLSHQLPTRFTMRQPPVYILRAPIPGMSRFQQQMIKPRTREKKMIQIIDPNSNRDVTQEILKQKPVGSLTSTMAGTPNVTLNVSGQGSNSSTLPLTSQQQAEANVRAQFAAQVAATLKDSEEKPKKIENANKKITNVRVEIFTAQEVPKRGSTKISTPVVSEMIKAEKKVKPDEKSQSQEDESSNSGESAQVMATLKKSSEGKPKRSEYTIQKSNA